ncbi:MAG: hypothetical protein ACXWV5_00030 [Flavitalea sp.]
MNATFKYLLLFSLIFSASVAGAQVQISGRIYDISGKVPLEAVSVLSSSGSGTVSDSYGRYTIVLNEKDSIWFSYLTKATNKYYVRTIPNKENFEIALHVYPTTLKEIRFTPKNYRMDSLQNRQDYAKAFDFRKPGIGSSINLAPGGGVGMDINSFISMFQFKKNRRMLAFQERLMREEADAFIDHRFNRALVIRLTGLRGDELNTFMENYRPSIEFSRSTSDYDFQAYIKRAFQQYTRLKKLGF